MCRSYILKMKILPGIDGHYIGKSTQSNTLKNSTREYTQYIQQTFNSGYGALNMLLRYPIKELAVFGLDFYNGGVPQTDEEKYNKQYTDTYGPSGTPNGPDKVLHDQLSQMMHCKNVLLKDKRFKLDKTGT